MANCQRLLFCPHEDKCDEDSDGLRALIGWTPPESSLALSTYMNGNV